MNPFNEWERMFGTHEKTWTGVLASSATDIQVTAAGWYRVSADQDFHFRGPSPTTVTASVASRHEWACSISAVVKVETASDHFSVILASSALMVGTYWIDQLAPLPSTTGE